MLFKRVPSATSSTISLHPQSPHPVFAFRLLISYIFMVLFPTELKKAKNPEEQAITNMDEETNSEIEKQVITDAAEIVGNLADVNEWSNLNEITQKLFGSRIKE